jgi:hypothetical protein
MAKLTRRQRRELESVLYCIGKSWVYLDRKDVIVAAQKGMATTTLDFTLPDGRVAQEVEKFIGSPLAMLITANQSLKRFLDDNG